MLWEFFNGKVDGRVFWPIMIVVLVLLIQIGAAV
jgi:hypothetical protein